MRLFLALVAATAAGGLFVEAANKNPLTSLPLALSTDDSFNFQLLISLGNVPYGAADILAAAQVIKPGSFSSFNSTFYELATGKHAMAANASLSRNPINVRDTYLAASSYYRSADFYLHGNWSDPLINEYWDLQTKTFNKAIASLPMPGKRITLPSDGFDTIGIWYAVDNTTEARPTLIILEGYDAAQEDSYMQTGAAALESGWNVLTLEGPGQPTVRREQGLGFIYDYEKVVTPAVDWLVNKSNVDMNRLALKGISMGGYLAARAAAFEPRLKALVLDDGVWDVQESFLGGFPPELLELYKSGNKTAFDDIINEIVVFNSSAPSYARWGVDQGLWSFKTHSPYEWIQRTGLFNLRNITDRIQMPVFVGNAVNDDDFPGQAVKVANALGSRATLYNFTGPASYHCSAGAFGTSNAVMLGWLENVFAGK